MLVYVPTAHYFLNLLPKLMVLQGLQSVKDDKSRLCLDVFTGFLFYWFPYLRSFKNPTKTIHSLHLDCNQAKIIKGTFAWMLFRDFLFLLISLGKKLQKHYKDNHLLPKWIKLFQTSLMKVINHVHPSKTNSGTSIWKQF